MSLPDRIDQLAAAARAIRTTAVAAVPSEHNPAPYAIPFTRAVLDTALGDLIRDIDASELGLFTLVPAPDADVRKQPDNGTRRGEISRVEFPGATPLRRQPPRRGDMFKPQEYEPEVYARAALKYLDRYHSIRKMPRARSQVLTIIDQLDETRQNIKKLDETLQELTSAETTSGPQPRMTGVAEEERRITDLQNRLSELRNQKDALLRSNQPKPASKSKPKSKPVHNLARSTSPDHEHQEDAFWSTPAASARTLRFTDRLLEEEPDFAGMSALSFDSPGPAPPKSAFARLAAGVNTRNKGLSTLTEDNVFGGPQVHKDENAEEDLHDESSILEVQLDPHHDFQTSFPNAAEAGIEDVLDEERTIVLSKVPSSMPVEPPPSLSNNGPHTTAPLPDVQSSQDAAPKIASVRITPELESIVIRIWSTVGDILLPGRSDEKPPRAKETLALIESLAIRAPSLSSPTSSIHSVASASAGPSPHQMNTAQLLHALLTAPNQAMPLNRLKAAIGGTRALYACVAKKLIRIDRGGGEQNVLFDA